MDYQIQANTRRCAATGRDLLPGEKFYSVLLDEDGKFVRKDYGGDAWHGPPEGTFSFWMGRVPAQEQDRRPRFDDEMLVECFQRLEGQTSPEKVNFRYVIALLLMRRKRFKFDEARMEGDVEILRLRCSKTRAQFHVVNPRLTEEQMAAVQEEVVKVLGWD
jgi:hypothetical protein